MNPQSPVPILSVQSASTDGPSDRRSELLDAIVDALLEDAIADLSLKPLAERVGTSARLLIDHFGNKETLLTDALAKSVVA